MSGDPFMTLLENMVAMELGAGNPDRIACVIEALAIMTARAAAASTRDTGNSPDIVLTMVHDKLDEIFTECKNRYRAAP